MSGLFGSFHAARAIDFTPRYVDEVEDGIPMHRLYFANGKRMIYFNAPGGWLVTGSKEGVVVRPTDSKDGFFKIESAPEKVVLPFDERGLRTYRQIAEDMLPRMARALQIAGENKEAVAINDWKGFEVTYDYTVYGHPFRKSVIFINITEDRQIRLSVEGRRGEFETLYTAAQSGLSSWYEK
jgi:hypothetical protein